MLKVMIADDEEKVCKLIVSLIDWETLEIELCATASNGVEELEMIERLEPDIVITDIRMPGLNGLEVIERVTKLEKQVNFIVVSGYKYFEYAYNALKFGVEDYLLKPIQKDELNQILRKLCVARMEKEKIINEHKSLKGERDQSVQLLQQSFIEMLFKLSENKSMGAEMLNEKYQVKFTGESYWCYALSVDCDNFNPVEEETIYSFTHTLYKKLKKYFSDIPLISQHIISRHEDCLVGIMEVEKEIEGEEILKKCFLEMLHFVESFHGYFITISISDTCKDYASMAGKVKEIYENLSARLFMGNNRVIKDTEIYKGELMNPEDIFAESDRTAIESCTVACDEERLEFCLKEIFRRLNQYERLDFHIYYHILEELLGTFYSALQKEAKEDMDLMEEGLLLLKKVRRFYQKSMIRNFIITSMMESMRTYVQRKSSKETKPVRIAKDYINANYAKDIGLEEVAKKVELNPVYLSVLFKRSTGQNFNDYLTHVRIEESKRLLKETNETMVSIAEMVGYGNAKYFSQLFTKVVGINPTMYRKLHS